MSEPVFAHPLIHQPAERAAVGLAALLITSPLDDTLEVLHLITTTGDPCDTLHRTGWLLLKWDALAEGGAL